MIEKKTLVNVSSGGEIFPFGVNSGVSITCLLGLIPSDDTISCQKSLRMANDDTHRYVFVGPF